MMGVSQFTPNGLVQAMKHSNVKTVGVTWQGSVVKEQQLDENIQWIKEHGANTIQGGYLCGIADPYLFLLCYKCRIAIRHCYLGNTISYDPPGGARYIVYFSSNHGHID
tara:strand:+ start:933 stop:1259 length:327 start_codon:yes stop_codon:yes gene_type:complete